MASPGGVVIGKASIKVLPDTSGFHRDLVSFIKKEQAKIKRQTLKVPIEYKTDRSQLLREMATTKAMLKGTDLFSGLFSGIGGKGLGAGLFNSVAQIAQSFDLPSKLKQSTGLLGTLGNVFDLVGGKAGRLAGIFGLAVVGIQGMLKASRTFSALSGFSIIPDTFGKIGAVIGPLQELPQRLGKILVPLGLVKIGFLELARNGLGLAGSLGDIVKMGALVPGALGTAAAGGFILKSALSEASERLKGMNAGWTALGKSVSNNFWDQAQKPIEKLGNTMLKVVTPAANQAAKDMGKLTGSLAEVARDTLGGRADDFFKALSGSMEALTPGLKSTVQGFTNLAVAGANQMPKVSAALNSTLDTFGNFMDRIAEDGTLERWVDDGLVALRGLKDTILGLASTFSGLVKAAKATGAPGLDDFGRGFREFADMVNSGEVQAGLRKVFAAGSEGFQNFIGGAKDQFLAFVQSLPESLSHVLPRIGKLGGEIFGELFGFFSDPKIGGAVVYFLDQLQKSFDLIQPYIPAMKEAVATLIGMAGAMSENQAKVLGPALGLVAEAFVKMAPVVAGLSKSLNGALVTMIKLTSAVIRSSLGALKLAFEVLIAPIRAVAWIVENLGNLLLGLKLDPEPIKNAFASIGNACRKVINWVKDLASNFGNLGSVFARVASGIMGGFNSLIKPALNGIRAGFDAVMSAVHRVATALNSAARHFDWVRNTGMAVANFFRNSLAGALNLVKNLAYGLSGAFGGVVSSIQGAFSVARKFSNFVSNIPVIGSAFGGGGGSTLNYNVSTPQGTMTENEFQRAARRVTGLGIF